MVLNVLLLGLVLWGLRVARRTASGRVRYLLLPNDDQPPEASDDPWPPARQLDRYVGQGLDQIEVFLARRSSTR
jgi:hypothetical protein